MKHFNLDRTILGFSDNEEYCAILTSHYVEGIKRCSAFAIRADKLEETLSTALERCAQKPGILDLDGAIHKADLVQTPSRFVVVIVKANELYRVAPNYFKPTDEELLQAYTISQRTDSPFPHPRFLEDAKALWTKQVSMRIDLTRHHDIGLDRPNIYCQGDW